MVLIHADGWRMENDPEEPDYRTAEERAAEVKAWYERHPGHDFPTPGVTFWVGLRQNKEWLAVADWEGTQDSEVIVVASHPDVPRHSPMLTVWVTLTCSKEQIPAVVLSTILPHIDTYFR